MKILTGIYKGRKLKTISAEGYRPAMAKVREAIFSMLDARGFYCEGCTVLDLFAGSGSLAFEALSRGATHATFIEANKKACTTLQDNATLLGISPSQYSIQNITIEQFFKGRPTIPYDIIFIDPPYYKGYLPKALQALYKAQIFHADSVIITETEPSFAIEPSTVCEGLEPIVDSRYGQTRVHFWVPIA